MAEDIIRSLEVLRAGGIILYPTDTIWGLGCDATNEAAIRKILRIKKSDDKKSMLILLDEPGKLRNYVTVPDIAWELIEVSTSPLTLIYPGARNLAPGLIAGDGSAGIRITDDEFCRHLISKFRKPVVSTSANITGTPSPAGFSEISDEIINSVDYVVQWRQEDTIKRQHSSIIKLEQNGSFKIIRK
jgi:L-threonylcarbamoyladenylate synthase